MGNLRLLLTIRVERVGKDLSILAKTKERSEIKNAA